MSQLREELYSLLVPLTGERLIVHQLNDDEVPAPEPGTEVVLSWQTRHSMVLDAANGDGA